MPELDHTAVQSGNLIQLGGMVVKKAENCSGHQESEYVLEILNLPERVSDYQKIDQPTLGFSYMNKDDIYWAHYIRTALSSSGRPNRRCQVIQVKRHRRSARSRQRDQDGVGEPVLISLIPGLDNTSDIPAGICPPDLVETKVTDYMTRAFNGYIKTREGRAYYAIGEPPVTGVTGLPLVKALQDQKNTIIQKVLERTADPGPDDVDWMITDHIGSINPEPLTPEEWYIYESS
jgi:hypothetical protein